LFFKKKGQTGVLGGRPRRAMDAPHPDKNHGKEDLDSSKGGGSRKLKKEGKWSIAHVGFDAAGAFW